MGRCLRVFKFKSAAENLEGVIVRLNEKLEGLVQFSGFIFHFVHDGVPRKHHYMVDLDPLGRVTDKWLLAFHNQKIMVSCEPCRGRRKSRQLYGLAKSNGKRSKRWLTAWIVPQPSSSAKSSTCCSKSTVQNRQLEAAEDEIVNEFRFKH
jgi:hypothetical protein